MIRTVMAAAGLAALLTMPAAHGAQAAGQATRLKLAQLFPPPLPRQAPAVVFYFDAGGKPSAPLSLEELKAQIASGAVKPDTLVWKSGTPSWVPAKQLTEIASLFASGVTDLQTFLVGTWEVGSPGGKGPVTVTFVVKGDGTLTGRVATPNSGLVDVSGAWVVRSTGDKRFDWTVTLTIQPPGQAMPQSRTEEAHCEIIDNDTIRDLDDGTITKRIRTAQP